MTNFAALAGTMAALCSADAKEFPDVREYAADAADFHALTHYFYGLDPSTYIGARRVDATTEDLMRWSALARRYSTTSRDEAAIYAGTSSGFDDRMRAVGARSDAADFAELADLLLVAAAAVADPAEPRNPERGP